MPDKLRILLVDDDEDEYVLLSDLVERMPAGNHLVSPVLNWVDSSESALERTARESYDVYLVDYFLGKNTGLDLMREWAARGSTTPVILLTGQGNYEVDLAAMESGASDYLVKDSLTPFALERAIRYTLEGKRARDELEERVRERTAELAEVNENLKAEIAARVRVEQALRASETRLRILAETTSAAIFIIQDDQIRYANSAARFVTGYSPDELLKMKFWELAHPAYQESLRRRGLIRQWIEGVPTRFELKIINRAAEERWVDITAGEMDYDGRPASVITAFDITERDQAEKELQKAKAELETRVRERTAELETERARLMAIVENAPVAILMADQAGEVVLANPVAYELIGDRIQLGKAGSNERLGLCHLDGRPYTNDELLLPLAALHGETFRNVEMLIHSPSGRISYVLANIKPIYDGHGHLNGSVGVFQEITQRKEREKEIEENALRAEVLATLQQAFAEAGLEYQNVLDTIALKISETLADGCIIRLTTEDGQWLEPAAVHMNDAKAQSAFDAAGEELREPVGVSRVGQVVSNSEPLVMLDTNTKEVIELLRLEVSAAFETLDIRSLLVEPLRTQQRIIGTLTVIRTNPAAPYTGRDQAFFADLAERAALAIENAMLHAEVKQLALRDSLTGEYNRRAFFELGKEEIHLYHRYHQPLSAIMLDIDNFKQINDRYGHALGDQILRMVIDHCRENIRHTDILGRYGGDEYVILLPKTGRNTAHNIAQRIRNAIVGTPFLTESGPVTVSVSLGVAEADPSIMDIETLIQQADRALYIAKRKGRNRVETI